MRTLYVDTDGCLYEVKCKPKDGQPNKIQIHEIVRFHGSNDGTPVEYNELDRTIQDKITRKIHDEFSS